MKIGKIVTVFRQTEAIDFYGIIIDLYQHFLSLVKYLKNAFLIKLRSF